MKNYGILDIGKTHVKFQLIDGNYETCFSAHRHNEILKDGLYPHIDVDGIWSWFLVQLKKVSLKYHISSINVSTHGATAALVSTTSSCHSGLILPIMDYEWSGINCDEEYSNIRPSFYETYSPLLPKGMNLGRQLFWLQKNYPNEFYLSQTILLYPQYWVWRMTDRSISEITSLGCHSDLWNPKENKYSSLALSMGWIKKFPPLHLATMPVGYISQKFIMESGVNNDCIVYSGLHDSNASYLRYMNHQGIVNNTVISTGTWTVCFSPDTPIEKLSEKHDMLINVDIHNKPVPCARFMGGREFGTICQQLNVSPNTKVYEQDISEIIARNVMAFPDFSGGIGGPFVGKKNKIVGVTDKGAALAALYVALMIDYELDLLGSSNDIVIEGAFAKNTLICRILAQLRPEVSISVSSDTTGTISGAASLCMSEYYKNEKSEKLVDKEVCFPTELGKLEEYSHLWRNLINKTS